MKLIYLKSALKFDSFDVAIGIKILFFRVLVSIEPGRSLLQFVTTNCLIQFDEAISISNDRGSSQWARVAIEIKNRCLLIFQ